MTSEEKISKRISANIFLEYLSLRHKSRSFSAPKDLQFKTSLRQSVTSTREFDTSKNPSLLLVQKFFTSTPQKIRHFDTSIRHLPKSVTTTRSKICRFDTFRRHFHNASVRHVWLFGRIEVTNFCTCQSDGFLTCRSEGF